MNGIFQLFHFVRGQDSVLANKVDFIGGKLLGFQAFVEIYWTMNGKLVCFRELEGTKFHVLTFWVKLVMQDRSHPDSLGRPFCRTTWGPTLESTIPLSLIWFKFKYKDFPI